MTKLILEQPSLYALKKLFRLKHFGFFQSDL